MQRLTIAVLIGLAGIILGPLWSNITKKWPDKKNKRYFRIILSAMLIGIVTVLLFPRLERYVESKGYILQFPLRLPYYRKVQGESSSYLRAPFEPPTLPENETICDANYCSDFDKEDWEGWNEFRESTKHRGALIPSLEREVFDTARLWFKDFQPEPTFKIELKVKPYHPEMGNIVISYGRIWRCIIAETNYNTITCEKEEPPDRLPSKHLTGKERKSIKPETDILISVETILTSEEKVKIVMNIEYIDIDSDKSGADFDFIVDMPTPKPLEEMNFIGIGIIDPTREDPAVKFKSFKLWEK